VRDIHFTTHGWEDFICWIETEHRVALKIKELIRAIRQNPFKGIGKSEPLKYGLKGFWSRRISGEHQLVYKVTGKRGQEQKCIIIQWRFH